MNIPQLRLHTSINRLAFLKNQVTHASTIAKQYKQLYEITGNIRDKETSESFEREVKETNEKISRLEKEIETLSNTVSE